MTDSAPRIEVTIAAPVDTVWQALRDKETIRHWHGWDYDGLDDEIELIYFTEVEEDTGARTLHLHGGDPISLEKDGDGTRVTLTRAPRGTNPDWDAYYTEITEGWITFLHQLKFAIERQPGAARRTLFFAGSNESGLDLAAELGLPEGPTVETTLLGEHVKGEVWFRSEHQLGVTVDAWGDGLLVVSSIGPAGDKPEGSAMAVLSTYGLDDARHAEIKQRWSPWWAQRFPSDEALPSEVD
ncbi:MAG TPA: SRPBCC domain-containing protein [Actinophytocola sp.]|jgi:hypothetical protein|uniref:SRPBCC family protein n=1 Tax=Actinophytocola sp. TaxID=1872138 RepID=UPI002F92918B